MDPRHLPAARVYTSQTAEQMDPTLCLHAGAQIIRVFFHIRRSQRRIRAYVCISLRKHYLFPPVCVPIKNPPRIQRGTSCTFVRLLGNGYLFFFFFCQLRCNSPGMWPRRSNDVGLRFHRTLPPQFSPLCHCLNACLNGLLGTLLRPFLCLFLLLILDARG